MTAIIFQQPSSGVKIVGGWRLIEKEEGWFFQQPGRMIALPAMQPTVLAALQSLVKDEKTVAQLEADMMDTPPFVLSELNQLLDFLKKEFLLAYELISDGKRWGFLEPFSNVFSFTEESVNNQRSYVFSRFALFRRDAEAWVLESPLVPYRVEVVDAAVLQIAYAFSTPKKIEEALQNVIPEISLRLISQLFSLGFLEEASSTGNDALKGWEFHDLYFHSRTRIGRHNNPVGYAPRNDESPASLPAYKRYKDRPVIYLPKADLQYLMDKEISLTEAMEHRKSKKRHGSPIITATEIGEFLYRIARIKEFQIKGNQEITTRPYPNAGAAYEIEFYLLIHRCEGLPPGFYHYEPMEHGLVQISGMNKATEALFEATNFKQKEDFNPQVIICLASRFGRSNLRYQTVSYANTLKNVGVLYQSMYLVATSMRLAACAWSTGHSDLFNAVAGSNYYEETSVGEFLLGAPPAE